MAEVEIEKECSVIKNMHFVVNETLNSKVSRDSKEGNLADFMNWKLGSIQYNIKPGQEANFNVKFVVTYEKQNGTVNQEFLVITSPIIERWRYFKYPFVFLKKRYLYKFLSPVYLELKELSVAPILHYARFSIRENIAEPDEDSLLVTEYLKNLSENKYVNLDEARMVVEFLARFHAAGIAIKRDNPLIYEQVKTKFGIPIHIEENDRERRRSIEGIIEKACGNDDSEFGPRMSIKLKETQNQLDRFECCYPKALNSKKDNNNTLRTICHTRVLTKNILKINQTITDWTSIRLIEWQHFHLLSPLTDVIFFICTSLELPFEDNINELLENYRKLLKRELDEIPTLAHSLEEGVFNQLVKQDARDELYRIIHFVKNHTVGVNSDRMDSETTFRLKSIFKLYEKLKWLQED